MLQAAALKSGGTPSAVVRGLIRSSFQPHAPQEDLALEVFNRLVQIVTLGLADAKPHPQTPKGTAPRRSPTVG